MRGVWVARGCPVIGPRSQHPATGRLWNRASAVCCSGFGVRARRDAVARVLREARACCPVLARDVLARVCWIGYPSILPEERVRTGLDLWIARMEVAQ